MALRRTKWADLEPALNLRPSLTCPEHTGLRTIQGRAGPTHWPTYKSILTCPEQHKNKIKIRRMRQRGASPIGPALNWRMVNKKRKEERRAQLKG